MLFRQYAPKADMVMRPFFMTQRNPTHHSVNSTQPDPLTFKQSRSNPTQHNPYIGAQVPSDATLPREIARKPRRVFSLGELHPLWSSNVFKNRQEMSEFGCLSLDDVELLTATQIRLIQNSCLASGVRLWRTAFTGI